MTQFHKKIIALGIIFSITLSNSPIYAAARKPTLTKKKISLTVGSTKKVSTKQVTSKTKVSIKQNKKSKKIAKVSWKKKTKKLVVTGKAKGSTTIKVTFIKNKKRTNTKLKIKVTKSGVPEQPTATPTTQPTAEPVPTVTPTVEPTAVPTSTPEPTEAPTATPVPVVDSMKDIYSDYFLVGAAINGSSTSTMALKHSGMKKILLQHFNSTVLSNLMKPMHLLDETASKTSEDGMPVCKFDTCDEALQFCLDNGIKMRGHTLVWHNQTPEWFFYEDYDTSKNLVDAETMEQRMDSYFRQVITYCQDNYPGVIYCWDVVNECVCTDENSYIVTEGGWKLRASTLKDNDFTHAEAKKNFWYATMGETYVEKAFTYARKYANKDVKLFYNDYNVFMTEKMNNIYMMVDELKQKGLIDGIGLQPTVLLSWPSLNSDKEGSFKTCLKKYAELGLELQVTELSFKIDLKESLFYLPSEEEVKKQADRYEEFMSLLLEMDTDNGGPCNITSVTVFGICDDYPLYDDYHQNLYLWDADCVPKPCFYSFAKPGLLLANK